MTVSKHEEYVAPSGRTISIQHNDKNSIWEVACWDADDSCSWYLEFPSEETARKWYERWR